MGACLYFSTHPPDFFFCFSFFFSCAALLRRLHSTMHRKKVTHTFYVYDGNDARPLLLLKKGPMSTMVSRRDAMRAATASFCVVKAAATSAGQVRMRSVATVASILSIAARSSHTCGAHWNVGMDRSLSSNLSEDDRTIMDVWRCVALTDGDPKDDPADAPDDTHDAAVATDDKR
jgi:hypothetical protein